MRRHLDIGLAVASRPRIFLALAVTLALGGCIADTPYQPMSLMGGYSDRQIAPDIYDIHVLANNYGGVKRASAIALLRASELTLNAGYTRFEVLSGGIAIRDFFTGQAMPDNAFTFLVDSATAPTGDLVIRFVKPDEAANDKALDAAKLAPLLRKELGVIPPAAQDVATK